jgi:hypothetical protein
VLEKARRDAKALEVNFSLYVRLLIEERVEALAGAAGAAMIRVVVKSYLSLSGIEEALVAGGMPPIHLRDGYMSSWLTGADEQVFEYTPRDEAERPGEDR